jgi:hypothetical protein
MSPRPSNVAIRGTDPSAARSAGVPPAIVPIGRDGSPSGPKPQAQRAVLKDRPRLSTLDALPAPTLQFARAPRSKLRAPSSALQAPRSKLRAPAPPSTLDAPRSKLP